MLKKIHIHVGLHKTGTTSIQASLKYVGNNNILKKNKIFYPMSWSANHSVPIFSAFCKEPEKYHMNIRRNLSSMEIEQNRLQNLEELKSEVKDSNLENFVFSGEDISILHIQGLKNFRNYLKGIFPIGTEIKILIYVRNPVDFASSAIQEQIKNGRSYSEAFNRILKNINHLFFSRINKFFQVFGRQNTQIFAFESAVMNNQGLVGDFLKHIGMPVKEIKKMEKFRINESISQDAANVISYINDKEPLIVNGRLNPKRENYDTKLLTTLGGSKFTLSQAERDKIYANAKGDIEWLEENCGVDYSTDYFHANDGVEYRMSMNNRKELDTILPKLNSAIQRLVMEGIQSEFKLSDSK